MSKKSDATAGTPATLALTRADIAFTQHRYQHEAGTSDFGREAAAALGLDARRVFKTLLVDCDGALVVAVVPVSEQLNVKALAALLGGKRAAIAAPADAERKSGYVVGGISPIGQKTALVTVVDDSARNWETIFVSGGRRGLDIELSPADLLRMTNGSYASIGR